ncbi:thiolase family protein [Hydrogenophaga sp. BPS33]|uniref:thiolase family protein n=1 Tax=Hydrogenophaga sp. BPS33 TaxID=2651974 RepID=UPI00131F95BF|nr:thiolase family protein [Hydrogenophaga sp. BPS33]QHE83701.1 thiolase family protein [Hydrogenophaga sp. BPS33]
MNGHPIYIRGVGYHPFGRWPDVPLKTLAATAALGALDDAGLGVRDLHAAFCANAYAGLLNNQESVRGETWLRGIGVGGIPVVNVENACASGSTAVHLASLAIASGAYDTVLVVGAEKMFVGDTGRTLAALANSADTEVMGNIGLQFSAVDAIRVREMMEEEDVGAEAFAWATVKNHDHAVSNPIAQYRKPLSMEQVLDSRMIADPIRLLMCSAISDGAAALVLSRTPGRGGVRVRASALASSPWRLDDDTPGPTLAARAAYAQAGIGPKDLSLAEVHDAVSPAELMHYRELELCGPGEVAQLVAEKATALGGRLPVNTSGGLNSRGHPVGATGVAQLIELALQLRGDAGARQVPGARLAMAHNSGGWVGEDPAVSAVHILEKTQ